MAAFPWLPLVQALIESQIFNKRVADPTPQHVEDLTNVAQIAQSRDEAQDAQLTAVKGQVTVLQKRVDVLERSLRLMLEARQIAGVLPKGND